MPALIVITGIDGAGKSTLARSLAAALRASGTPAACLYGRPIPLFSRLLLALGRLTLQRRSGPRLDYPADAARKKRLMLHPLLSAPYTLAVLLDYFSQVWLKLLLYSPGNHLLTLDRYIYDTLVSDLACHLSWTPARLHRFSLLALRLLPSPACTLLIDLHETLAYHRKNDIPHIRYLNERRPLYLTLLHLPNVYILDGAQPPDALLKAALEIISQTAGLNLQNTSCNCSSSPSTR